MATLYVAKVTNMGQIVAVDETNGSNLEHGRKLTNKQALFKKYYLATGDKVQACKLAGYKCKDNGSYATLAWELQKKLKLSFRETAEALGITQETIAKVFQDGLTANVVKHHTHQGHVIETTSDPDHAERRANAEALARLAGYGDIAASSEANVGGQTVQIVNYGRLTVGDKKRAPSQKRDTSERKPLKTLPG